MKPHRFHNCLHAFYGSPWAILPDKLDLIEAALLARVFGDPDGTAALPDAAGRAGYLVSDDGSIEEPEAAEGEGFSRKGTTAVIPVRGTITPRPSVFSSGGTSAAHLARAVDKAAESRSVRSIVLDIDSPGGSVFGIEEAAARIRAARDVKPVYAVASPVAASAAYWLGSQATKFYATPSGQVGSVGVIYRHFNQAKAMEQKGLAVTTVTSGKFKDERGAYAPLSDEAKARMQADSDAYYRKFLRAVADGRGIDPAAAERKFGQGRMHMAGEAVDCGMIDGEATVDQVVADLQAADHRRRAAASHLAFAAAEKAK